MALWNYMKKFNEPVAKDESLELDLPDWGNMDDSSARVSPADAFELCERYTAWFPDAASKWRTQRPEKCLVEFKL